MILRGNLYRLLGKREDLYKKRYSSCISCPLNSANKKKLTPLEKAWNTAGEFCTECGCPLQSKLREPLSECPVLKWGQEE